MGCIPSYKKASHPTSVDNLMRKSGASNLHPVKCDSFPNIFPLLIQLSLAVCRQYWHCTSWMIQRFDPSWQATRRTFVLFREPVTELRSTRTCPNLPTFSEMSPACIQITNTKCCHHNNIAFQATRVIATKTKYIMKCKSWKSIHIYRAVDAEFKEN